MDYECVFDREPAASRHGPVVTEFPVKGIRFPVADLANSPVSVPNQPLQDFWRYFPLGLIVSPGRWKRHEQRARGRLLEPPATSIRAENDRGGGGSTPACLRWRLAMRVR